MLQQSAYSLTRELQNQHNFALDRVTSTFATSLSTLVENTVKVQAASHAADAIRTAYEREQQQHYQSAATQQPATVSVESAANAKEVSQDYSMDFDSFVSASHGGKSSLSISSRSRISPDQKTGSRTLSPSARQSALDASVRTDLTQSIAEDIEAVEEQIEDDLTDESTKHVQKGTAVDQSFNESYSQTFEEASMSTSMKAPTTSGTVVTDAKRFAKNHEAVSEEESIVEEDIRSISDASFESGQASDRPPVRVSVPKLSLSRPEVRSLIPNEARVRDQLSTPRSARSEDSSATDRSMSSWGMETDEEALAEAEDGSADDPFSKFTLDLLKRMMKEEKNRSKHQLAILRLREKALEERAKAELELLEKKRKERSHGDDKMPSPRTGNGSRNASPRGSPRFGRWYYDQKQKIELETESERAEIEKMKAINRAREMKQRVYLTEQVRQIQRTRKETVRIQQRLESAGLPGSPMKKTLKAPSSKLKLTKDLNETDEEEIRSEIDVSGYEHTDEEEEVEEEEEEEEEKGKVVPTAAKTKLAQEREHADMLASVSQMSFEEQDSRLTLITRELEKLRKAKQTATSGATTAAGGVGGVDLDVAAVERRRKELEKTRRYAMQLMEEKKAILARRVRKMELEEEEKEVNRLLDEALNLDVEQEAQKLITQKQALRPLPVPTVAVAKASVSVQKPVAGVASPMPKPTNVRAVSSEDSVEEQLSEHLEGSQISEQISESIEVAEEEDDQGYSDEAFESISESLQSQSLNKSPSRRSLHISEGSIPEESFESTRRRSQHTDIEEGEEESIQEDYATTDTNKYQKEAVKTVAKPPVAPPRHDRTNLSASVSSVGDASVDTFDESMDERQKRIDSLKSQLAQKREEARRLAKLKMRHDTRRELVAQEQDLESELAALSAVIDKTRTLLEREESEAETRQREQEEEVEEEERSRKESRTQSQSLSQGKPRYVAGSQSKTQTAVQEEMHVSSAEDVTEHVMEDVTEDVAQEASTEFVSRGGQKASLSIQDLNLGEEVSEEIEEGKDAHVISAEEVEEEHLNQLPVQEASNVYQDSFEVAEDTNVELDLSYEQPQSTGRRESAFGLDSSVDSASALEETNDSIVESLPEHKRSAESSIVDEAVAADLSVEPIEEPIEPTEPAHLASHSVAYSDTFEEASLTMQQPVPAVADSMVAAAQQEIERDELDTDERESAKLEESIQEEVHPHDLSASAHYSDDFDQSASRVAVSPSQPILQQNQETVTEEDSTAVSYSEDFEASLDVSRGRGVADVTVVDSVKPSSSVTVSDVNLPKEHHQEEEEEEEEVVEEEIEEVSMEYEEDVETAGADEEAEHRPHADSQPITLSEEKAAIPLVNKELVEPTVDVATRSTPAQVMAPESVLNRVEEPDDVTIEESITTDLEASVAYSEDFEQLSSSRPDAMLKREQQDKENEKQDFAVTPLEESLNYSEDLEGSRTAGDLDVELEKGRREAGSAVHQRPSSSDLLAAVERQVIREQEAERERQAALKSGQQQAKSKSTQQQEEEEESIEEEEGEPFYEEEDFLESSMSISKDDESDIFSVSPSPQRRAEPIPESPHEDEEAIDRAAAASNNISESLVDAVTEQILRDLMKEVKSALPPSPVDQTVVTPAARPESLHEPISEDEYLDESFEPTAHDEVDEHEAVDQQQHREDEEEAAEFVDIVTDELFEHLLSESVDEVNSIRLRISGQTHSLPKRGHHHRGQTLDGTEVMVSDAMLKEKQRLEAEQKEAEKHSLHLLGNLPPLKTPGAPVLPAIGHVPHSPETRPLSASRALAPGISTDKTAVVSYINSVMDLVLQQPDSIMELLKKPAAGSRQVGSESMLVSEDESMEMVEGVLGLELYLQLEKHRQRESGGDGFEGDIDTENNIVVEEEHIHNKAVFDAINEVLESYRTPQSADVHLLISEGRRSDPLVMLRRPKSPKDIMVAVKDKLDKWVTIQAGTLPSSVKASGPTIVGGVAVTVDEDQLAITREEKLAAMLAQDINNTEEEWINYDVEEREVYAELSDNVLDLLVIDTIAELNRLHQSRRDLMRTSR